MAVPPDIGREELDQYTRQLQSRMDELEADLVRRLGGEAVMAPMPNPGVPKASRRAA
jgi:hypothetical protein